MKVEKEEKEPSETDVSELTPSQESIRLRRRRLREKTPTDEIPILYESPEKIAARKAERAMLEAVLLIQAHERARVARAIGKNGKNSINEFFDNSFLIIIFQYYSDTSSKI